MACWPSALARKFTNDWASSWCSLEASTPAETLTEGARVLVAEEVQLGAVAVLPRTPSGRYQ